MSFIHDFKKFAFKGNVLDLAIGVVIGGAFGKIVSAMVADLVMPIVALFMPRGDWRDNGLVLRHGATAADDVVLKYGDFLGSVLDFLIISMVLFIVISRLMKAAENALLPKSPASPAEPTDKTCPFCCETIPIKASRCKACTSELAAT